MEPNWAAMVGTAVVIMVMSSDTRKSANASVLAVSALTVSVVCTLVRPAPIVSLFTAYVSSL